MREIIFDTETTGLDKNEDRVIEIGCVELKNRFLTGKRLHVYLNPEGRRIHPNACAIHGISNEQLLNKPTFSEIANDFLAFIDGAVLIAHNAMFDLGFINAELDRIGILPISLDRVVDTLALARRKHPMGSNSLDALCKRYGIDNSQRTFHGALLDSEILADIYLELIGGKQRTFSFDTFKYNVPSKEKDDTLKVSMKRRSIPLASLLTEEENMAHIRLLEKIGERALWFRSEKV
ncbi:MAG: DNA polymerase III subunit epsilon [Candidatus Tokpelaia sp. JSC161]|jgi:DNA polymerase-3 subunit epsilon|nr:MAG: DNA polymerase III subunit epsilon [Candidatus Tokpelaia sp. JSC161]